MGNFSNFLRRAARTSTRISTILILVSVLVTACGLAMDADGLVSRGQVAYDAGDFRAAAIDARNVLQKNPDHLGARLLLGKSALAMGDGASAEKEIRRAMELGAPIELVALDLGMALNQQQKAQHILDEISVDLAAGDEARLAIMQLRADAHLLLRQSERARHLYAEILAENPRALDAQLGVVESYVAEKNLLQAKSTLEQVVTEFDEFVDVWTASGSLNLRIGALEGAEKDFNRAVSLLTDSDSVVTKIRAYGGLAEAYLAQDKKEDARALVTQLVELAPDSIPVLQLSARLDFLDENWKSAQEKLQRILQAIPDYMPARYLLGAVQLKSGNLRQAEMYLSAVVAASPDNQRARQLLAETRLQLARFDTAQQALQPIMGDSPDAQSLSLAAFASAGLGKTDDAIAYLKRSLEVDPGNTVLQFQLVSTYLSAGKVEEAEKLLAEVSVGASEADEYQRDALLVMAKLRDNNAVAALSVARELVNKWPDTGPAHVLLGAVLMSQRNLVEARAAFEEGARLLSYNVLTRRYLAAIDEAEGYYQDAGEHYKAIVEAEPDAHWAMFALARLAAQQEDNEESIYWLEKYRAADTEAVEPRIALASQYFRNKQYEEAATVAREVIDIDAKMAAAHNLLGLASSNVQEFRGAVNSFRRAAELDSENSQYRLNLAKAQQQLGNLTLATQTLGSNEEQSLAHIPSAVFLANMKAKNDDLTGALDLARKLREYHPMSPVPYVLEAELQIQGGDWQAASSAYDEALAVEPIARFALRSLYIRLRLGRDDWDEPVKGYLESRPLDATTRLVLANEYIRREDRPSAVKELERIVELEPGNVVAQNNLAWTYYVLGDARAEQVARRAYELSPSTPAVGDTLGWILVENGAKEEGVELLRKAVELHGGGADIQYHFAAGLVQTGDEEQARRVLERILSSDEQFGSRSSAEELFEELQ